MDNKAGEESHHSDDDQLGDITQPTEVGSNPVAAVTEGHGVHDDYRHHPAEASTHQHHPQRSPPSSSPPAPAAAPAAAPATGAGYYMEYRHGGVGDAHNSRRSPPPTTARASANAFPATPASNSAVAMMGSGGRRHHHHHQKVSPKAAPTPSSSSTTGRTTPGSTPNSKTQRGLRHFSVMVCKHVEEKRITTYNQVADELVRQVIADRNEEEPKGKFDEKNIRRRVYDALNVLLAMGIISKDKKDIIWRGLPSGPYIVEAGNHEQQPASPPASLPSPPAQAPAAASSTSDDKPLYTDEGDYSPAEFEAMERERAHLQAEVKRKQDALQEILVQQVCFRNLVMRNQRREHPRNGPPAPPPEDEKIPLPFIICNTKPSAVVQCDMNKEKTDVMFEFDSPFEINDDNTILKRMNMDKTSVHALQGMVPEDMFDYCHHAGLLESVLLAGEDPARVHRRAPRYHDYDRAHRY